jgi:hypothetical protein
MDHNQQQKALQTRLDQIPEKLMSTSFLKSEGLGNEIGFYVFDYAPEFERLVNQQLEQIKAKLDSRGQEFVLVNLFDAMLQLLKAEEVLEDAFELHKNEGDAALTEALHGILSQEYFAEFLCQMIVPEQQEFVLLSGLGACWPLIRGHSLLNALQARMGKTPLVLFFPGNYTGLELHPFGKITSSNYYRAFELVTHQKK